MSHHDLWSYGTYKKATSQLSWADTLDNTSQVKICTRPKNHRQCPAGRDGPFAAREPMMALAFAGSCGWWPHNHNWCRARAMYAHSLLAIIAHLPPYHRCGLWKEDEDSLCFVAGPTVLPMQKGPTCHAIRQEVPRCLVRRRRRSSKQASTLSSLFVWLWLLVNDRKFSAGTVFFSHTNQPTVFLHEPATKRTSQPNRL